MCGHRSCALKCAVHASLLLLQPTASGSGAIRHSPLMYVARGVWEGHALRYSVAPAWSASVCLRAAVWTSGLQITDRVFELSALQH
jgi:hypothetical protein